jgi:hypothetical protein
MDCNCYVRTLSEQERFVLRRGAHSQSCIAFRKSRDPVDAEKDEIIKAHYLQLRDIQELDVYCSHCGHWPEEHGSAYHDKYCQCREYEPDCNDLTWKQIAQLPKLTK